MTIRRRPSNQDLKNEIVFPECFKEGQEAGKEVKEPCDLNSVNCPYSKFKEEADLWDEYRAYCWWKGFWSVKK